MNGFIGGISNGVLQNLILFGSLLFWVNSFGNSIRNDVVVACPEMLIEGQILPPNSIFLGKLPKTFKKLSTTNVIHGKGSDFKQRIWEEEINDEWEPFEGGERQLLRLDSNQTGNFLKCFYAREENEINPIVLLPLPSKKQIQCEFIVSKNVRSGYCKEL